VKGQIILLISFGGAENNIVTAQEGGECVALKGSSLNELHDMPPDIVERILNDHHMSWVALSSSFRIQEDAAPSFRHPDFSAWIKVE